MSHRLRTLEDINDSQRSAGVDVRKKQVRLPLPCLPESPEKAPPAPSGCRPHCKHTHITKSSAVHRYCYVTERLMRDPYSSLPVMIYHAFIIHQIHTTAFSSRLTSAVTPVQSVHLEVCRTMSQSVPEMLDNWIITAVINTFLLSTTTQERCDWIIWKDRD